MEKNLSIEDIINDSPAATSAQVKLILHYAPDFETEKVLKLSKKEASLLIEVLREKAVAKIYEKLK